MSWFRVDDGLNAHRKVRKVRRSHPDKTRDVAPMGIWALAGSWCGAHSPSGFIPADILEDWDDEWAEHASRLVAAGFWIEATQGGEQGYQFHDWKDFAWPWASDDGKRGNHVRWHEKKGITSPDCEFCAQIIAPDSGGDSGTRSQPESRTLPNPSLPIPTPAPKTAAQETCFEDFWKLYPRKIGKEAAVKAWRGATKKAKPDAIIAALREQLPSLQMQRRTDGDFRPHPATWLNQGRWADEVDVPKTAIRGKQPEGW